ncbi:MAG: ABC transporter permease [Lachnospiraceae bacterium]|nr:ABC transporter permease [Lachnospiraceae bacterium]
MFTSFLNSMPGAVAQGIIWGIMAIGVYITYKILDVADLSVDGSFGTGGAVLVICMSNGIPVAPAMLIAFAAGCVAGFVTGIFHVHFGIPAILSGILTQLGLYSINLRILGGKANVGLNPRNYNLLLSLGNPVNAIIVGLVIVVILILLLYLFFGTNLGSALRATGNNQNMARANGINTNTAKILGLVISNGIVAFSGALLAQFQGYADINMGRGAIVIGLAAVIIGEVLFHKIFKNFALKLLGAIIGGIIYYLVITLVLSIKIPISDTFTIKLDANDLKLFTALVVAIFLGIPYWKKTISAKRIGTAPKYTAVSSTDSEKEGN